MNLAVLRLNLALDDATQQRSKLRAENAALAVASSRARSPRRRSSRSPAARTGSSTPTRPRSATSTSAADVSGRDRQANRRIRLLLGVFVLVFARRVRAGGRGSRASTAARYAELAREPAPRDAEDAGRPRHDLRPHRRAARDRRADDDGVRRPAPDPQPARGRARRAATCSASTANALYPKLLDKSTQFVYVQRFADPAKAALLEKRKLAGLGFYPEERRTYPQGKVGAQVIGYAGIDNKGLTGLEVQYDRKLSGRPGSRTIVRDGRGQAIDVIKSLPEQKGADVFTTLDHTIQANAEAVLRQDGGELGREGGDRDRARPEDGRGARDGAGAGLRREPRLGRPAGAAAQPRGHRPLRARLDVQARHRHRRALGGARQADDAVHAAVLDPRRRPDHPRLARARHADVHRRADPRVLVERRRGHARAEARRARASRAGSTGSASATRPASTSPARAPGSCCRSSSGRARRSATSRSARASR